MLWASALQEGMNFFFHFLSSAGDDLTSPWEGGWRSPNINTVTPLWLRQKGRGLSEHPGVWRKGTETTMPRSRAPHACLRAPHLRVFTRWRHRGGHISSGVTLNHLLLQEDEGRSPAGNGSCHGQEGHLGWAEGWAAHRSAPGQKRRLGGKLYEPLGKGKGLRLLPKEGRSLAMNHPGA